MIRRRTAIATTVLIAGALGIVAGRAPAPAAVPPPPGLAAMLDEKAIDLTYPFDEQTIYWPSDQSFHWKKTKWGPGPDGHWYASATYGASEHGGTHLDSPIHFAEGQATADQIPISKLIGPAVVVDIAARCAEDRDYALRVEDLDAWEKAHGRIPDGAIVLVRTGWGQYWPDKKRYLGSDTPGDTAHLHFPSISGAAAEWLTTRRKVDGVGVDTASTDPGTSRDFPVHRTLGRAGVFGLENVAQLDRVPATGATVIALPMKIKGGSGGPTRIIAILP